jgi:hypothetical protein
VIGYAGLAPKVHQWVRGRAAGSALRPARARCAGPRSRPPRTPAARTTTARSTSAPGSATANARLALHAPQMREPIDKSEPEPVQALTCARPGETVAA